MRHKIIVIGGGGHGKIVVSLIQKLMQFELLGYIDLENKGPVLGTAYLGSDNSLSDLLSKNPGCAIAFGLGNTKISTFRERKMKEVKDLGFVCPAIISPDSFVHTSVTVGEGTVICDGAIIQADSIIGSGVIINTKVSVDHDCHIGDFVHLCPGTTISGGCSIDSGTLLGTGASVIHGISIGKDILIGAGSCVVGSLTEKGTYFGVPARLITA